MKSKNFSLKLISGIAGCFAISYLAASAAGLTKGEPRFPYSMIKRYSDQGQAWINVKNVIEIPSQGLEEIDLQTLATDIHFETGEKQTIQLLLEGKYLPRKDGSEQVLQYEVKNHALLVRTDESDRSQNFSFSDDAAQGVLTIIVPKEVTVLKLKSLSGKVSGDGLKLSLLDLETISGEFNFTSLKAKQVNFKTVSGGCELAGRFDRLEGRTVSGDVLITSANPSPHIKLDSTSADVELSYEAKPDSVVEFHTTSGGIRIEKEAGMETEASGSYSRVLGNGQGMVLVNTLSGSLHIGLEGSEDE